ncbi:MAG TPA: hypothetical protein VKI20_09000 [Acidimicrobiales bacterium]|nr:hypothetical protein [Acidimicrobiales bacterium]
MSPLRRRRERLADDALVVVRGGVLSEADLARDALRTFRRFGEYGVSVLAAPTPGDLDQLERTVLRRFETVTVMMAGTIRSAGLELVPTFRSPHYTVLLPELQADAERLARCDNELQRNPHFRPDEVQT